MKLIASLTSPYARKIRIAIAVLVKKGGIYCFQVRIGIKSRLFGCAVFFIRLLQE